MATIRELIGKNKKKKYHVEIRIKGYPPMRGTFDRLTDARIWIADNESKMKRGKHIKDAEAKKHTLADLIDRYISNELQQRKTDRQKFETQLNWWKKQIGAYLLTGITPILIGEYRDKLQKEPIKYTKSEKKGEKPKPVYRSDATVNRYMAALSIAFTVATNEWGWVDENPMRKVKKRSEPRGRVKYLSDSEVTTLLQECKGISYEIYLCVLIALSTGARYGEIINLTWENVDLQNKQFYFMDTKNGSNRGVPITTTIYNELVDFKKIRNIKSNYLFTMPDGSKLIYLRSQYAKALKAAGIKDFTFHDLRHTAASYLAKDGASLLEIATILGHKTLAMVQRYAHLTKQHTAGVLENMNNTMFKNLEG